MTSGSRHTLAMAAALIAGSTLASAQSRVVGLGTLNGEPSSAHAISADGRYAFGRVGDPVLTVLPARWALFTDPPQLEMLTLPPDEEGIAVAASNDGSSAIITNGTLWRDDTPLPMEFARLPHWGSTFTVALAPDETAYGMTRLSNGTYRITRWPQPDQPEEVPLPPGAVSATLPLVDGTGRLYFIGRHGSADNRLYRATATGFEVLTPLQQSPELHSISWDGSTLGGARFGPTDVQNWVWNTESGFSTLFTAPHFTSYMTSVSPDGSVAFGYVYSIEISHFAWSAKTGVISTDEYFESLGVDLQGWSTIRVNQVSPDGSRYVGYGFNPDGQQEAVVVVVEACRADFNGDDAVNSQDFFDFLGAFFAGDQSADFNGDTFINSQDFFDFLGAFFTGCD